MKRIILNAALIMLIGSAYAQSIQKGSLIGLHYGTVDLNPDVTMNQYKSFYMGTVIPEAEKNFPGMKLYLVKGVRGEHENSFGVLYVFESEAVRDKYFKADGTPTELGKSSIDKAQAVMDKLGKLGTISTKYTDWVVQ